MAIRGDKTSVIMIAVSHRIRSPQSRNTCRKHERALQRSGQSRHEMMSGKGENVGGDNVADAVFFFLC